MAERGGRPATATAHRRGGEHLLREAVPSFGENTGKRAAEDELARKKRKTAGAASRKPSGISLGDDQTTRPRRTAVFDWSDDDEISTASLPSTTEPPQQCWRGRSIQGRQRNPQATNEGDPYTVDDGSPSRANDRSS